MDIKQWKQKAATLAKKYRYGLIILLIGIILMQIPSFQAENEEVLPETNQSSAYSAEAVASELSGILASVAGVGKVKVMLSVSAGEETVYQTNEDQSSTENGVSVRKETVILTGSDRQETALIRYTRPPTFLGAIIVCQGADQPAVKLAVVEAVSRITGLSSDQISVVKMK